MMGALVVTTPRGGRLELSGFTDSERELADNWPLHFNRDSTITYKYREQTASGSVTEGRYWRRRDRE
jgi:hypothetical protein